MKLRNYQKQAVKKLKQRIEHDWEDDLPSIQVLKAITGAGKTVILGHMIDEFIEDWDENFVVLWVSPGKGGLLNQSYQSVNSMIGQSRRVYLYDASITSMLPSDIMFVNWEKLNKKNNTAMKDGEKTNFKDLINNVRMMGCKIILAVDESHKNFNADKSDKIVKLINPDCVVKASATPNDNPTVVVGHPGDFAAKGVAIPSVHNIAPGLPVDLIRDTAADAADWLKQIPEAVLRSYVNDACKIAREPESATIFESLKSRCKMAPELVAAYLDAVEGVSRD